MEIRIEKVYDGHRGGGETYVQMKQIEKGKVEYFEEYYFSKYGNSKERSEKKIISSYEANQIYKELKKYAKPYYRNDDNGLFEPMR